MDSIQLMQVELHAHVRVLARCLCKLSCKHIELAHHLYGPVPPSPSPVEPLGRKAELEDYLVDFVGFFLCFEISEYLAQLHQKAEGIANEEYSSA